MAVMAVITALALLAGLALLVVSAILLVVAVVDLFPVLVFTQPWPLGPGRVRVWCVWL